MQNADLVSRDKVIAGHQQFHSAEHSQAYVLLGWNRIDIVTRCRVYTPWTTCSRQHWGEKRFAIRGSGHFCTPVRAGCDRRRWPVMSLRCYQTFLNRLSQTKIDIKIHELACMWHTLGVWTLYNLIYTAMEPITANFTFKRESKRASTYQSS